MPTVRHNPEKWSRRASAASGDYVEGANNPRRPWEQATLDAVDLAVQGFNEAASDGRIARGIVAAGDEKWKKGIREKGRTRYQSGVSIAKDEYDRGFRPFVSVIEGVQLAPRGPKGQNYGRVQQIGEALREAAKNL